jgi:hypothetical protein
MKRKPEIVSLYSLLTCGVQAEWKLSDGSKWWGPARYYGPNQLRLFGRLKAAWLVFTGRADAMLWPDHL